jgi:hypothetical protein
MMQTLVIRQPEQAYLRTALFAIELLDAVTLERVTYGVRVYAEGMRAEPVVNSGGLFVWRGTDASSLQKIVIDPGTLPYEAREVERAALRLPPMPRPLTTIQLSPRVDYAFPKGMTGLRGTLVEDATLPRVPVRDAEVHLRWLDDDGTTWRDAPGVSRTNAKGDFAVVARLAPADVPQVDANGAITVRLRVSRSGMNERSSTDVKLMQGRVADPTALNAMIFAWDDLQP